MKRYMLNRRDFLTRAGAIGLVFAATRPIYALSRMLSNSTENELKLLDFVHITDVHITDGTNPLRVEVLDDIPGLDAAWRPQQHMSATALDAVIRSINQQHAEETFDFMISTGDMVDNAMQNEFQWFMDVLNGNIMSDDYLELVDRDIMTPVNPQGIEVDIPWYAAIGNHDTMIVGNFPAKLMEAIHKNMKETYGFEITTQEEVIELLFNYGFDMMPENMDGYYSFDPNDYVHCIVLNTNNDNWVEGLIDRFMSRNRSLIGRLIRLEDSLGRELIIKYILITFLKWLKTQSQEVVGGIAEGTLNRDQFEWMKGEIENNSHKLCLIFSHHGPDSFLSPIGNVTPNELRSCLCSYDNVIAHIYGHNHNNHIVKEESPYGYYWGISTSSIIEYPQEWRRIAIWDNGDGTGILSCRMFQHGYSDSLNQSMGDPQSDIDTHIGRVEDRDVDLEFNISSSIAENISNNLSQNSDESSVQPSGNDDSAWGLIYAFLRNLFGRR
ncbi:MAG: metallophosphoesterase [Spirochaetota bacterium]|nr:metallophosphoesterase [Spirochaetota bacterium]